MRVTRKPRQVKSLSTSSLTIIPCHTPHATHKDKRDRESVWASLMKETRDQGTRGDTQGWEGG